MQKHAEKLHMSLVISSDEERHQPHAELLKKKMQKISNNVPFLSKQIDYNYFRVYSILMPFQNNI